MKRGTTAFTGLIFLLTCALLVIKFVDNRYTEIAGSFLAAKFPALLGGLQKLPGKPLAERLAEKGFALGNPLLIRIFKQESTIELWMKRTDRFELALSFPVCAWSGELGPKLAEGDRQSPEGFYLVSERNLNPNSAYHRAINVGFPNAYDQAQGRTGSFLMIHGSCVSIGCYAIRDAPVDDVYAMAESAFSAGQKSIPIHIFPFRLTPENLSAHNGGRWIDFWRNLSEGEAMFQATKIPPPAFVCNGKYRFGAVPDTCVEIAAW